MRIKSIIGNNDLSAVVRGGGHVFVVQLIGMGVAYLSQVFLARWLGVLEFGVYVYAFAWASLLSVPAAMGLPTSVMKLVSEYMALSKWGMASGVISWSRMLVISSGLFITAVAAIIINLLGGTIGNEYTSTLYVAIPIIPLIALLRVQAGIARSFGRPLLAYFPDSIVRPFLIIAGVYAFLLAGVRMDGYMFIPGYYDTSQASCRSCRGRASL
jgi:O-antigen/teichoic acid export membrane protein